MALFAGKATFPEFLMMVALLGGLLCLVLLAARPIAAYVFARLNTPSSIIPRILTAEAPIPYGVAIGSAFLVLMWTGKIDGIPL